MKNILKLTLALAALLVIGSAGTASAQKFGRINTAELVQAMPEMKTAEANLQKIADDHGQVFEAMQVEYRNKVEELSKNRSTLTEAVRNMKEQEIAGLIQRIESYQQTANEDIAENQKIQFAPVIEKARAAIATVAKANGYMAIIDVTAGAFAYYDEATITDILPMVKKQLGIN